MITEAWRHSSDLPASRTSDGDVEALGAAHEAEVVAAVELELAHLVKSQGWSWGWGWVRIWVGVRIRVGFKG